MNRTRGITLMALALLTGACKDVPTFPGHENETAAVGVEAAMDVASAQAEIAVQESLARAGADTIRPTRRQPADTTRPARRPDDPTRTRPGDPQRPDERRPSERPNRNRAELAVALAGEAIDLAARLIKDHGGDPEQARLLQDAEGLYRKAVAALKEDRDDAAAALAEDASQMALKAVVLPGGVTEQEARMIHDVAAELLEQAKAAVAADPTEIKRHLLTVAEALFRAGTEQLTSPRDSTRGVVPLWKSAVISSWLIG